MSPLFDSTLAASRICSGRFFFNDTATTEIYTLSLHDALPIYPRLQTVRRFNVYASIPSPVFSCSYKLLPSSHCKHPLRFHAFTNCPPRNPFLLTSLQMPGGVGGGFLFSRLISSI